MPSTNKYREEMRKNAAAIATPGKGIFAADESSGTIKKRFDGIELTNTEEFKADPLKYRNGWRELTCKTEGIENFISGTILFEEQLFADITDDSGEKIALPTYLLSKGILPGIKVDKGLVVIPETDDEKSTQGLTDLGARCAKYYAQGARFAKWRNVLSISDNKPSDLSIECVSFELARYAAICQANGLVPIVEPEILMDGDHTLEKACEVAEKVLSSVYKALADHHVYLEGTLLKPNMVCPGVDCPTKYSPEQIAEATVTTLRRTVPAAVPGINFLSGGLSEVNATIYLNEMNKSKQLIPWTLSFSYGRALQASALKSWKEDGYSLTSKKAQATFLFRAKANSAATLGKYTTEGEVDGADTSLFQKNYTY